MYYDWIHSLLLYIVPRLNLAAHVTCVCVCVCLSVHISIFFLQSKVREALKNSVKRSVFVTLRTLRSGVFHYYNISRTIWIIKSQKTVTYVLWLLTSWYMSWYCTMLCNFGTSIWYSIEGCKDCKSIC